jgi:hypothetical protein
MPLELVRLTRKGRLPIRSLPLDVSRDEFAARFARDPGGR